MLNLHHWVNICRKVLMAVKGKCHIPQNSVTVLYIFVGYHSMIGGFRRYIVQTFCLKAILYIFGIPL